MHLWWKKLNYMCAIGVYVNLTCNNEIKNNFFNNTIHCLLNLQIEYFQCSAISIAKAKSVSICLRNLLFKITPLAKIIPSTLTNDISFKV